MLIVLLINSLNLGLAIYSTMGSLIITFDETKAHQFRVHMAPRHLSSTSKTSTTMAKVERTSVLKRLSKIGIGSREMAAKIPMTLRFFKSQACSKEARTTKSQTMR